MSDERFYQLVDYTCPRCGADAARACRNSGDSFYAPVEHLERIPKETPL